MNKQKTVPPYNGILLGNIKEWTVDTCNDIDESQMHYLNERSQAQTIYIVWFHLHDVLAKVIL